MPARPRQRNAEENAPIPLPHRTPRDEKSPSDAAPTSALRMEASDLGFRGAMRRLLRRRICRRVRRFPLHRRGEFCDLLSHDLAGLELNSRPGWYDEAAPRLIRVAAYAWFGELDLKDAEVAKFDCISVSQCICDVVQSFLDDVEDLVLNQACLVANFNDEFPFR
jgi:hypothetical protein